MSGESSSGKSFGTWIENGRRKGPPIVWEASLGPNFFFKKRCMSFQLRVRVISPMSLLSEDMITPKKIGQNACIVRTA